MKCSCLSALLVYATLSQIALRWQYLYSTFTYQLVNDIRARRGNACVRTCKTRKKIEQKLKRQRKLKYQRKTKTKMILRTKNTA